MGLGPLHFPPSSAVVLPFRTELQANWLAVYTRPRHEKKVERQLSEAGVTTFLPLLTDVRKWSDRSKAIEVPLFPGYVFVQIVPTAKERVAVLRAFGVIGFVGLHGQGAPIPDREIEQVRTVLQRKLQVGPYPFLEVGTRIRVASGPLSGIEGILVGHRQKRRLVISVSLLQRSLAITVEGCYLQAA
jgi:transcription termination/antitermination protein NusG